MQVLEEANDLIIGNNLKVFETACEQAIFYGNSILYLFDILPKLKCSPITEVEILSCINSLCKMGSLKKKLSLFDQPEVIFLFSIEHQAFDKYLRNTYKNYESLFSAIKEHLQNNDIENLQSEKISECLKIPKMIVNHFLEELHFNGFIKVTKRIRGNWFVEEK